MKCPHCNKEIHLVFEEYATCVYKYSEPLGDEITGYEISHGFCPSCNNLIVLMYDGLYKLGQEGEFIVNKCNEELIYPKGYLRPVEPEVPDSYATEYRESAAVKNLSAKASAAISRRILQTLLRDECKIKPSGLAKEIDDFLEKQGIPSYLSDAVDAIRNVGNFAAHPLKDSNTGEIVDVEDGEADWLLDVLDAMFDYLFVQPKRLEKRRKGLNKKLKSIGKPPMKES